LAYFTAAVLAESLLTLGSDGFARGLAIGLGTRLADVAPWLFLGTALVLLIAVFRGLPANFRDFSDQLHGRRPPRLPRPAPPEERREQGRRAAAGRAEAGAGARGRPGRPRFHRARKPLSPGSRRLPSSSA